MNRKKNTSTAEPRWIVEGKGPVTDAELTSLIAERIVDLYHKFPSLPEDEQRNFLAGMDKLAACIGEWPAYTDIREKFAKRMSAGT